MPLFSISQLVSRSAVSKPATRLYGSDPEVEKLKFDGTRGHIKFVINSCNFCTLCAKKCPTDAIVVEREAKTWTIDRRKCILCGACVEGCRKSCLTCENESAPPFDDTMWRFYDENTEMGQDPIFGNVGVVKPADESCETEKGCETDKQKDEEKK